MNTDTPLEVAYNRWLRNNEDWDDLQLIAKAYEECVDELEHRATEAAKEICSQDIPPHEREGVMFDIIARHMRGHQ